jgi:hypothetical protein
MSTMRRWADRGDVRVVRTPGGHRRVALVDVRDLQRRRIGQHGATAAALRGLHVPTEPLPLVTDVLERSAGELLSAAARGMYDPGHPGWFGQSHSHKTRMRWVAGIARAARYGYYARAVDHTVRLDRHARNGLSTQTERMLFLERFGDLAVHYLRSAGAEDTTVKEARALMRALRYAILATGTSPCCQPRGD